MSFNNKPATATIPFLSPLIAPGARLLGPLLAQLAESPLSATFAAALEAAKGMSPSVVGGASLPPLLAGAPPAGWSARVRAGWERWGWAAAVRGGSRPDPCCLQRRAASCI
jgi:hypothetical protein